MLVISDVVGDARVLRESATLAAAGHRVHVVGRGPAPADPALPPGVTATWVGGAPPRGGAPRLRAAAPGRAARWALLPAHRRAAEARWNAAARAAVAGERPDVVHAHDAPTLGLGVALARRTGARLVYDAHEYWTGRRREGRPTPLADRAERRAEGRSGARADLVLTVSDALAARLRGDHGWPRVAVVRNTFPSGPGVAPAHRPRGLVYAGRVAAGRDLGTLARAAPRLAPLAVTVLGPGDARGLDLRGIDVRPALPIDDVDGVLRAAGLALVPLEDGWENHRVALPNKLFQAVRAGVPVVAADLPALREVVTAHDLGTLYRPGDPDALVAAVRRACADHARHAAAVRRAAPALSWEADADRLLAAYAALERAPAGSGVR